VKRGVLIGLVSGKPHPAAGVKGRGTCYAPRVTSGHGRSERHVETEG
jgi:hypothetical protein